MVSKWCRIWLWLKKPVPKWVAPGKWKHGPKPAVCPSDRLILSDTHFVHRPYGCPPPTECGASTVLRRCRRGDHCARRRAEATNLPESEPAPKWRLVARCFSWVHRFVWRAFWMLFGLLAGFFLSWYALFLRDLFSREHKRRTIFLGSPQTTI